MRGRLSDPRRATAVAAVGAALAVLLAVVLTVVAQGKDARDDARSDALRDAGSAVETLLSYDFRSITTAAQDHRDLVTGTFADEYPTYVTETLSPAVVERKLRNTTTVVEGAVVSDDGDTVVVLLFVDQEYGVVGQVDPATSGSRVRVTMRSVDGDWRVAELEPV